MFTWGPQEASFFLSLAAALPAHVVELVREPCARGSQSILWVWKEGRRPAAREATQLVFLWARSSAYPPTSVSSFSSALTLA